MVKVKDLVEKYGNREIDEDELEKLLKPEKIETIYDLKKGDSYWFINTIGKIYREEWINNGTDKEQRNIGNIFLTEEDAKNELEYRKIKAELKRYASMCEEPVDWKREYQVKYALAYDHKLDCLDIAMQYEYNVLGVYFTNRSILDQAIKEIGEERIIKYYLGIKTIPTQN